MYIIKKTKMISGIYLIWNIVENKAYVGLAKNLSNRTLDHVLAICNADDEEIKKSYINDENKNLIAENNKEFIHFPLMEFEKEISDEQLRL